MRAKSARRHSLRVLAMFVACSSLGALIPSTASALLFTNVTSPANDSMFFVDQSDSTSTSTAFTVTGTVNAADNVDVDCTSWNGGEVDKLVTNTPIPASSFSIPVTYADLFNAANGHLDGPCALSVLPTGTTPQNPGATTQYAGPVISISSEGVDSYLNVPLNFDAQYTGVATGSAGSFEFTNPEGCGLEGSWITTGTTTLTNSNDVFNCVGAFYGSFTDNESGTIQVPQELTVDGHDAVVANAYNGQTTASGYEPPTFTDSFSGGDLTVHDDEPIMLCASACNANSAPTGGFDSSGVELDRTWQTEDNGLVALQTDSFRSTDGKPHTLTALEDDDFESDPTSNATADFPGTAGFNQYAPGDIISPVSGPGAIYLKPDAATPATGDPTLQWPQGAIAYAKAPTGTIVIEYWTNSMGDFVPEFYLPYTLQVPAGGKAVLRFAYVQDFALSNVQTLAQQALAGFHPNLTISTPAGNAPLASPRLTLTGTASDAAGIATLTVDGTDIALNSAGNFSEQLLLPVGASTLTVVATDADGLATTQTASVSVAKQRTTSLGVVIKPRTDRRFPYRYAVGGKLKLPTGVGASQGCAGKVQLTVTRGKKKLMGKPAAIGHACGWSARLTLAKRRLVPGHGKLTITAAFPGNVAILPYTAKRVTVSYGRR